MSNTEQIPFPTSTSKQSGPKSAEVERPVNTAAPIPEIPAVASQKVQEIAEKLVYATTLIGESVGEGSEKLHLAQQRMLEECRAHIRKRPVKSILFALGVGYVLKQLCTTSKKK